MKTKQEIEKMKDDIQVRIEKTQDKLADAKDEFSFNIFAKDKIRLVAQYNILLEVLK